MELSILQSGLEKKDQRVRFEDRWICKLQSLSPTGLNKGHGKVTSEMYQCWKAVQ